LDNVKPISTYLLVYGAGEYDGWHSTVSVLISMHVG